MTGLNTCVSRVGYAHPVGARVHNLKMSGCDKAVDFAVIAAKLGIPADYGPSRRLKLQREALEKDLVVVGHNPDGQEVRLERVAAGAWDHLCAAAAADGLALLPLSGFRSVQRQTEIIRGKLAAGETIEAILKLVAAPGYSEHHTGRAIDIGAPNEPALEEGFATTAAFRWLERHAEDFEFSLSFPAGNVHGIGYEPWHWRFR